MAKDGQVKTITGKDKTFEGPGVEGQKDAEDKSGTFDKTGATSLITHRDGLKRVWFRDGVEIGVEDAG